MNSTEMKDTDMHQSPLWHARSTSGKAVIYVPFLALWTSPGWPREVSPSSPAQREREAPVPLGGGPLRLLSLRCEGGRWSGRPRWAPVRPAGLPPRGRGTSTALAA